MALIDGVALTSAFGGVDFAIVTDGVTLPVVGVVARVTATPIPYGGNRTLQVAGYDPEDLQVQIVAPNAAIDALVALAMAGAAATLERPNEGDRTAVLERVAGIQEYRSGVGARTAALTFKF